MVFYCLSEIKGYTIQLCFVVVDVLKLLEPYMFVTLVNAVSGCLHTVARSFQASGLSVST